MIIQEKIRYTIDNILADTHENVGHPIRFNLSPGGSRITVDILDMTALSVGIIWELAIMLLCPGFTRDFTVKAGPQNRSGKAYIQLEFDEKALQPRFTKNDE